MIKTKLPLWVILAIAFGTALLPALTLAAGLSSTGPPNLPLTNPDDLKDGKPNGLEIVWQTKTQEGVLIQAFMLPIPEGVELKAAAEKVFKPLLEQNRICKARMGDNKEITLSDGTRAYYSEMDWNHKPSGGTLITTMVVSVYKDGMCVFLAVHPWDNYSTSMNIIKSLKFK